MAKDKYCTIMSSLERHILSNLLKCILSTNKNKKIIIKIKLFIKYLIKCFVVLFFIYYFIKNILYLNNYLKNITPRSLEHYNYISIDDDLYNKIKLVNNYIN